jgi:hypothetical protein
MAALIAAGAVAVVVLVYMAWAVWRVRRDLHRVVWGDGPRRPDLLPKEPGK